MILGNLAKSVVVAGEATVATNATASYGPFDISNCGHVVLGVHNDTSFASITRLSIGSNRAKYAFVEAQVPGATNYRRLAIVCDGYHSGQAPNTASEAGCAAVAHGVLSGGNV